MSKMGNQVRKLNKYNRKHVHYVTVLHLIFSQGLLADRDSAKPKLHISLVYRQLRVWTVACMDARIPKIKFGPVSDQKKMPLRVKGEYNKIEGEEQNEA